MSAKALMNLGFFLFGGVTILFIMFAILTVISVAGTATGTFVFLVTTFVKTFGMIGVVVAIILCGALRWVLS